MMIGTRNVTSRLSGSLSRAFIESGSARARRDAVATTKRMSSSPNAFQAPTSRGRACSSPPAIRRPSARIATTMSPQPPGPGRPGGAHLRQALLGRAADCQTPTEIVEQPERGHERGVGLAGARAVAAAQLEKRRAVLGGHAPPGEIAAAHDVRRHEREDRADLSARGGTVGAAVEARNLPDLDLVGIATRRAGGPDDRAF